MTQHARNGEHYDVAIIGGGPAGCTAASLLRKYNPVLRVILIEKEKFPRDHIGESQLPSICPILDEMGVWDKVEAAGFPIKIGASYTWGKNNDRWEFNFYPPEDWKSEPRPGKFEGQRKFTAFQVDRSIYDAILLRHAESMGAEVREETPVLEVLHTGDRVDGLKLESGEVITARWYIDASGVVGVLRRDMGVNVKVTDELRNIAIWNYWQNAEWAIEIGVGATRIQVRSLPYGWFWFIPLGPTRTSIGVVVPAAHYKSLGVTAEELYMRAVNDQKEILALLKNATREDKLYTTKDWSQLSDRIIGENWFLVGEVAGFADPILSAGMSLAHSSARDAAYTIMELDRGEIDAQWLRSRFNDRNRANIRQHIRFGQYWYSANSCFTELQENCAKIADEAGLKLTPQSAWRWLSQGGFTNEQLGLPSVGSFAAAATRQIIDLFGTEARKTEYLANGHNQFTLNLKGAKRGKVGRLVDGRIELVDCWERGERRLPLAGHYAMVVRALERTDDAHEMMNLLRSAYKQNVPGGLPAGMALYLSYCLQALETMIEEAWVFRRVRKGRPLLQMTNEGSRFIRTTEDERKILDKGSASPIRDRT